MTPTRSLLPPHTTENVGPLSSTCLLARRRINLGFASNLSNSLSMVSHLVMFLAALDRRTWPGKCLLGHVGVSAEKSSLRSWVSVRDVFQKCGLMGIIPFVVLLYQRGSLVLLSIRESRTNHSKCSLTSMVLAPKNGWSVESSHEFWDAQQSSLNKNDKFSFKHLEWLFHLKVAMIFTVILHTTTTHACSCQVFRWWYSWERNCFGKLTRKLLCKVCLRCVVRSETLNSDKAQIEPAIQVECQTLESSRENIPPWARVSKESISHCRSNAMQVSELESSKLSSRCFA